MQVDAVESYGPFNRIEYLLDLAGADGAHQGEASNLDPRKSFLKPGNKADKARPARDDIVYQRDGFGREQLRRPTSTES